MYLLEFACPECGKLFRPDERLTVCPYDNKVLVIEFKTLKLKPETGETNA